jgi:uncharacterized protein DUF4491
MNFTGLILGLCTFIAIGLGFLWVVKLEYYVGAHIARVTGAVGLVVALASLFIPDFMPAAIVGIVGGTIFWGATELPDQEMRVRNGVFRANPKKKTDSNGARR